MNFLLFALAMSFALCLMLVPLARVLARRCGLVDRPDGHRKIHTLATPVSGGLAILVAVVATLGFLFILPENPVNESLRERGATVLGLLLGALLIVAVGIADDLRYLRGRHKLAGQIAAAGIVVTFTGGIQYINLFGNGFDLGWFGVAFTIFFLVGTINSLNLIDGMDGLLGSVGVILSLSLAAMACLAAHWWAAAIALALAGALFGFLRYNLKSASIFLGDSGSMLVGLILGTLAIQCSLKGPATLAIAFPLGLLILPIFDTAAAIIRRKLTGRSIYETDRGHLHHCVQRSGYSGLGTVAVISLFCLAASAGVLASRAFDNEWITLVTAVTIIATLVLTRLFGYAEAKLISGRLRVLWMPANIPQQMEVRLQGTAGWEHLWRELRESAAEMNLQSMLLDVNAPFLHEAYHARWGHETDGTGERPVWLAAIPMTMKGRSVGRLVLSGEPIGEPAWVKIAAVMKVIEDFNDPVKAPADLRDHVVPAVVKLAGQNEISLEVLKP
jgi:UDP-GlcNAc:undecaprenyl-phosphate GlcNAc-1-phosphate transferase